MRLPDWQITDAFHAVQFSPEEVEEFTKGVEEDQ
jgi:hypothetical protein